MREAGRKQLIIGLVIAGVGLVLTLASYAVASSGSGGGSYFIFPGAVVFGLIRAGRGFSMMSKAGSSTPWTSAQSAQQSQMQRIQVEHSSTNEMPPPPPSPPTSPPPSSSMWD